jgi:hypothetical protein
MISNQQNQRNTSATSNTGRGAANKQAKTSASGKSLRGFAAMDPAEQRRIASEDVTTASLPEWCRRLFKPASVPSAEAGFFVVYLSHGKAGWYL